MPISWEERVRGKLTGKQRGGFRAAWTREKAGRAGGVQRGADHHWGQGVSRFLDDDLKQHILIATNICVLEIDTEVEIF